MADPTPSRWRRFLNRAGRLSPVALAIVGFVVMVGVTGGGYAAFRTYDYVQHDNDFCMQCHLMAEPYERFARSAHQGLGCKACHRPNLLQRSRMGLTAVVENPDEISVHADVPNETCAECHVEGDPEKWRAIANSAGHRAHLESPKLQGLQCVGCHSTSIHEFAPIDRTCATAGCHENQTVRLGAMSDLTIHCAACHTFVAPVAESPGLFASEIDAALLPDRGECLSCHAMRVLVEMPDPDPHQGSCAACHNPHEQTEPAEAAESCTNAGCHTDAAESMPIHRGLGDEVLSDCVSCHKAHDFALDASDCTTCHESQSQEADATFDHSRHADLACAACHTSEERHGAVSVTSVEDCRSCHHSEPVATPCADCHEAADAPDETFVFTRPMRPSVGQGDPQRRMRFPHAAHATQDCATCHTEGTALAPPEDLDCQSCHAEHHDPVTDCAACHRPAPVSAHPPSEAHVTCSGAGCHQRLPFEGLPRNREFCLACHQDMGDHEPGRRCADCHQLPPPREGS